MESGSGPSAWTARTIRRWCPPLTAMRRPRRSAGRSFLDQHVAEPSCARPLKPAPPPADGRTTAHDDNFHHDPGGRRAPASYTYSGNWLGTQTRVLPSGRPSGGRISEGSMIDFTTGDPNLSCLDNEATLNVYFFDSDPTHDYVITRKSSGDCANAAFIFVPPIPSPLHRVPPPPPRQLPRRPHLLTPTPPPTADHCALLRGDVARCSDPRCCRVPIPETKEHPSEP